MQPPNPPALRSGDVRVRVCVWGGGGPDKNVNAALQAKSAVNWLESLSRGGKCVHIDIYAELWHGLENFHRSVFKIIFFHI